MSELVTSVHSNAFINALEQALEQQVRQALKAPLMKIAEAEIEKAVDEAVKVLDVRIETWRDDMGLKDTIELLVKKRGFGDENSTSKAS